VIIVRTGCSENATWLPLFAVLVCGLLVQGSLAFGEGETPTPAGVQPKADHGIWYQVPQEEKSGLRYAASWSARQRIGGKDNRADLRISFVVWQPADTAAHVKFLDYEGAAVKAGQREALSAEKIVGKLFDVALPRAGQARFEYTLAEGAPEELETAAKTVCKELLPLIFLKLPGDFDPKKTSEWGPASKGEAKGGFTNRPECDTWRVRETLTCFPQRSMLLIEAVAKSVYSDKDLGYFAWQRKSVSYDSEAKRVRWVSDSYRYDGQIESRSGVPREYDYRDWTVIETPHVSGE
jgi:hypothetical protein